jgi:hypothetical protein
MKKSDWTMIIFVALVTGFVAFMVTHSIMGDDEESKPTETVKTTILFSNQVDKPNSYVFRVGDDATEGAINPTVPITTGLGDDKRVETETCKVTLSEAKSLFDETESMVDKALADINSVPKSDVEKLMDQASELSKNKSTICVTSGEDSSTISSQIDRVNGKIKQLQEKYNQ